MHNDLCSQINPLNTNIVQTRPFCSDRRTFYYRHYRGVMTIKKIWAALNGTMDLYVL